MTAQQQVALVTGASSGIGKEVALRLVGAGFQVVGTSRDASRLTGREGLVDLDVSSDASVTGVVEYVLGRFGRVDVLVNNAGIGSAGAAVELSVAQDRKVIDVNVLHIAAIVQIRHDTEGRAYYRRKLAEARTPMEALRCLKRRISDAVYRQLLTDAQATTTSTGPGGHSGASSQSSAADLSTPVIGSSDRPLPGPARPTLPGKRPPAKTHADPAASRPRRRAGAVKVQRPTGRTTLTATSAGAHSTATGPRP